MSLDKRKCDPELGLRVRNHLIAKGVETPLREQTLTVKERIDRIQSNFVEIMEVLGLDLTDDSLMDTPRRVAKMYVSEIFYGLDPDTFPKVTVVENKFECDEMIVEGNITLNSTCEHHFLPIMGYATVGYIPKSKVLGLSKLNRIVEYLAKRPQVQERLTSQIYHTLSYILETDDVAVVINGTHTCVSTRGIEDTNSNTTTSRLGGTFKSDPSARAEFMALARMCDI